MRFLYPLLMIAVLLFVFVLMFSGKGDADPKRCAEQFLQTVQQGDYKGTVQLFGGNTCRCPKKGGWVSYLVYASAQEPNLAFTMGKPFEFKNPVVSPVVTKGKKNVSPLPWQKPEDVVVDLDISFDRERYMPMFLPLKMAYGIPMSKEEFDAFLRDPDKDCRQAFTLRLRPSLAPGTVARPEASKGIEYKPTDKAADVNQDESISLEDKKKFLQQFTIKGKHADKSTQPKSAEQQTKAEQQIKAAQQAKTAQSDEDEDDSFVFAELEEAIRETQGDEVAMYLHPKDAGPVKLPNGQNMLPEEIGKSLPRLHSAKLRLHIVRREKLRQWTVYHFGLMYPVLQMPDGKLVELKSHCPPSGELPAQPDTAESKKRADK